MHVAIEILPFIRHNILYPQDKLRRLCLALIILSRSSYTSAYRSTLFTMHVHKLEVVKTFIHLKGKTDYNWLRNNLKHNKPFQQKMSGLIPNWKQISPESNVVWLIAMFIDANIWEQGPNCGEKIKIRVFKLNCIAQKDLEFEEYSGMKKGADNYWQVLGSGRQWIHGYANRNLKFVSLLIVDM